jgi:uncharacterized repeat protein (TIGR03803 family)
MDRAGNLNGVTEYGGENGTDELCTITGLRGCGTLFQVTSSGTETLRYSFCSVTNCTDGASPLAGLIADQAGNLYGTTYFGGAANGGAVFELVADGTETVLYSFDSLANGIFPAAGLIADSAGNLYGTASEGGDYKCNKPTEGCGVVFEVTP